jgi:hypothetical protein
MHYRKDYQNPSAPVHEFKDPARQDIVQDTGGCLVQQQKGKEWVNDFQQALLSHEISPFVNSWQVFLTLINYFTKDAFFV